MQTTSKLKYFYVVLVIGLCLLFLGLSQVSFVDAAKIGAESSSPPISETNPDLSGEYEECDERETTCEPIGRTMPGVITGGSPPEAP